MNDHSHRDDRTRQLVNLDHARRALTQANTVAQIKAVRDKAESVRSHAQRASLGIEVQNFAAELKLQAERLGGQFLAELKLRGGDRKSKPGTSALRLSDLGLDKNQSARWQLEASVPEAVFGDFVCSAHAAGREISSAALLRLAKNLRTLDLDDLVVPSDTQLHPRVSTKSHLLRVDWSEPEPDVPAISKLNELLSELRNHYEVLTSLVESVCRRASLSDTSTDYRAIQRYLAEIDTHLSELVRSLRRIDDDPVYRAMASRTTPN